MCFRSLYDIVYPVHVGRVRQFNPCHAEVISGNNKSEFACSVISQNWDGAGRWNLTSWEIINYILHTILLTTWRCKEQWHKSSRYWRSFPAFSTSCVKKHPGNMVLEIMETYGNFYCHFNAHEFRYLKIWKSCKKIFFEPHSVVPYKSSCLFTDAIRNDKTIRSDI